MTELEIAERMIRAAEIEDRLPRVGPGRLKAQNLPYVHSEADMLNWGKRVGEKDQLRKEDAEAHAAHRREFWERVSVSARDVSEAEEAWGWLALVETWEHRAALAAWARCMADNKRQFWIPEGLAHGFAVVSDNATFCYQCTALYDRAADAGIRWNDADIAVDWPLSAPLLSDKDAKAPFLRDVPRDKLPKYTK